MKLLAKCLFAAIAVLTFAAPAATVQPKEDPLMVTAICDEAKSRATALKLFAYANTHFAKFKNVTPLKEQVSIEAPYDDGAEAEFHNATFKTFQANFIREPNGNKALIGLSTKSTAFRLPWGLKLGQTMEQVRKILGPPTAVNTKALLYEVGGEAISDIFFNFESGRLVEVSWNYGIAD